MKSRYETHAPLPDADAIFIGAFNIMADKVLNMAQEFKNTHDEIVPELLTPLEREEYDWITATWANVRLNAVYILHHKGIEP